MVKQNILKSFKEEMARLFILSFAVFLFILFFQPFPLDMLDFNNRLLFVTGFGAIFYILSWLIFILLPVSFSKRFQIGEWESGPPLILELLLIALSSTAFAFYIRYVGKTPLSFYIVFKIGLVCLLPIIILKMMYRIKSMDRLIHALQDELKACINRMVEEEKLAGEEEIEILSENKSEKLKLRFHAIVLVKSADNYIEIYYLLNDQVERKIIRNTLKSIESQLIMHKRFIRCHRTRIVNTMYIDKLWRDFSGYYLKMNVFDEKIPVSRQFLVPLKEALSIGTH